jgi:hypothetical protein
MKRLPAAQAQLSVDKGDVAEAVRVAVEIHERVISGDISVSVDDIVRADPEAERRAAAVPHYRKAVGAEQEGATDHGENLRPRTGYPRPTAGRPRPNPT